MHQWLQIKPLKLKQYLLTYLGTFPSKGLFSYNLRFLHCGFLEAWAGSLAGWPFLLSFPGNLGKALTKQNAFDITFLLVFSSGLYLKFITWPVSLPLAWRRHWIRMIQLSSHTGQLSRWSLTFMSDWVRLWWLWGQQSAGAAAGLRRSSSLLS